MWQRRGEVKSLDPQLELGTPRVTKWGCKMFAGAMELQCPQTRWCSCCQSHKQQKKIILVRNQDELQMVEGRVSKEKLKLLAYPISRICYIWYTHSLQQKKKMNANAFQWLVLWGCNQSKVILGLKWLLIPSNLLLLGYKTRNQYKRFRKSKKRP